MKVDSTSKIVACVENKKLCPGIRLWLATPLVCVCVCMYVCVCVCVHVHVCVCVKFS